MDSLHHLSFVADSHHHYTDLALSAESASFAATENPHVAIVYDLEMATASTINSLHGLDWKMAKREQSWQMLGLADLFCPRTLLL